MNVTLSSDVFSSERMAAGDNTDWGHQTNERYSDTHMEVVSFSFELRWGVDLISHDPGDGLQINIALHFDPSSSLFLLQYNAAINGDFPL